MSPQKARRPQVVEAEVTGPPSDGLFHYVWNDTVITLPALSQVERTFEMMEALADGRTEAFIVALVRAAADAETLAVIRKMTATEMTGLFDEWHGFSGFSAGNSLAS